MDKNRSQRVKLLVRKLNKARRQQAKQIDILCNDMVSAHKDFVEQLKMLTFTADFYQSLLGKNDLAGLLDMAIEIIKGCAAKSNAAIFLNEHGGYELYTSGADDAIELDTVRFESYFTQGLVDKVCRANWVCSLDDLFEMGLEGDLNELGKISVAAVPLERIVRPMGFILVYRVAENKLTGDELQQLSAITPGLSNAIKSLRSVSQTAEMG